ncbi:MAG: LysR family transcriptional regulator [Burkholderiales bacterium]
MPLSLDALQTLDAIARNGSFARAAAELHRVPSALTYTIQQLESDLGLTLFDREGRRAVLTAAGHELLNEGRILLKVAADLECRIQQVAKGWETELRIAFDTITPLRSLFGLIQRFESQRSGTRIRLSTEVLGGTWDALMAGRADLIVGASAEVPSGGGYAVLPLMPLQWVFAAAPSHPIVGEQQPLTEAVITRYRAISVADSSRNTPPRTVGLISGQDVLTVATMSDKLEAQIAGLGVGYVPLHLAAAALGEGKLVALSVLFPRADTGRSVAWRANRTGKALRWFIHEFEKPEIVAAISNAS